MDKYTFGQCKVCYKDKALKNGVCKECKENDMPDFMKELFGGFKREGVNG